MLLISWPYFISLIGLWGVYSFVVYKLSSTGSYRPFLKYLTITTDFFLCLSIFMVYRGLGIAAEFFQPQGQASVMIMVLILLVVLSAMRYSRQAIVYSAVLSAGGAIRLSLAVAGSNLLAVHSALVILFCAALIVIYATDFQNTFIKSHHRESLTRFLPREMVESIDRGEISLELGGK